MRDPQMATWMMQNRALDPIANESNLENIGAYLKQFKRDTLFLDANQAAWRVEYPDQWVVVFEEKLVGMGRKAEDALLDAQGKGTLAGPLQGRGTGVWSKYGMEGYDW